MTAITMIHAWFLFVALVPQSSAQWALSAEKRYLYVQLEDALVNDATTLEQLKEVFIRQLRPHVISFRLNIRADSIPASNCSSSPWDTCEPAFCPVNNTSDNNSSTTQWKLCSPMNIKWRVPRYVDAVDLIHVLANTVVPWCTHGVSYMVLMLAPVERYYYYDSEVQVPIRLSLKKLKRQPSKDELTDAVGELGKFKPQHKSVYYSHAPTWNACSAPIALKYQFEAAWLLHGYIGLITSMSVRCEINVPTCS